MSVSKKEIYELIEQLPDDQTESVILYLKELFKQKKKKDFDPEKYWGILKDTDINVEEECRKLRSEWDRDIY